MNIVDGTMTVAEYSFVCHMYGPSMQTNTCLHFPTSRASLSTLAKPCFPTSSSPRISLYQARPQRSLWALRIPTNQILTRATIPYRNSCPWTNPLPFRVIDSANPSPPQIPRQVRPATGTTFNAISDLSTSSGSGSSTAATTTSSGSGTSSSRSSTVTSRSAPTATTGGLGGQGSQAPGPVSSVSKAGVMGRGGWWRLLWGWWGWWGWGCRLGEGRGVGTLGCRLEGKVGGVWGVVPWRGRSFGGGIGERR